MKIVCLVENTIGNELCKSEHGLSLYIETENKIILADTGASDLFLENAVKLGVDLTKVKTLFLSHGHYDHGGGILAFHKINPDAEIVMQKTALGDYWHISENVEKYIGLDARIKELGNLVLLDGDALDEGKKADSEYDLKKEKQKLKLGENIRLFTLKEKGEKATKYLLKGNFVLKERKENQYIQDNFVHEQYLVLEEKGKSVLISGCAHNGILNILEEYHKRYDNYPDVVISGFHMRKKEDYTEADFDVIKETARRLKKIGILCYTGHCTGEEPYKIMKEIMGEQLQYLHCGNRIDL